MTHQLLLTQTLMHNTHTKNLSVKQPTRLLVTQKIDSLITMQKSKPKTLKTKTLV